MLGHIVFLLYLHFSASSAEPKFMYDYENCLSNIDVAKVFYTDFYNAHLQSVKEGITFSNAAIQDLVYKRNLSPSCEEAYPLQSLDYYSTKVFQACGGVQIHEQDVDLSPHWNGWSEEMACGWMLEVFPVFRRQVLNNNGVIARCEYVRMFEKIFKEVWDQCD